MKQVSGKCAVLGVTLAWFSISFARAAPASRAWPAKHSLTEIEDEYNYVVVGGGVSGLVVANRLTDDPNVNVLVIEYGDFDDNLDRYMPYGSRMTTRSEDTFVWQSTPQAGTSNRVQVAITGAVVGGGSIINGMTWDRGAAADYDAWEELGSPGWGWEGLLPYFRKSSQFDPPAAEYVQRYNYTWKADDFGEDGPIHVSFPTWEWPGIYAEWKAWEHDMGIQARTDAGADGDNAGLAWAPNNIDQKNGSRSNARTHYYAPVSSRPNLHLLTKHYVSTVTFDGKKATGVDILSRAGGVSAARAAVKAKNEVILAAGAISTAKILQQSGIGRRDLLESLNVTCVEDLPGVGMNFQDHPNFYPSFQYTKNFDLNPNTMISNRTFYEAAMAEWLANKTGPMTTARGASNMMFLPLRDLAPDHYEDIAAAVAAQRAADYLPVEYSSSPDLLAGYLAQRAILQRHFLRADAAAFEFIFSGSGSVPMALEKPLSRGTVQIRSADPDPDPASAAGAPTLDFGVGMNPVDVRIGALAMQLLRRWADTATMAEAFAPVEVLPGRDVATLEQIEKALRDGMLSASFAHPSGTAAMMPRELGGVLDPELRVYGVEGLRVVDASMMPMIPGAHLQATVYAVAEKAADLVKAKGKTKK